MAVHDCGRLTIEIDAVGDVARALADEFAVLPSGTRRPHLRLREVPRDPTLIERGVQLGDTWVDDSQVAFSHPHTPYALRDLRGECMSVVFYRESRRSDEFPARWQRLRNWNYLTTAEEAAKGLLYDGVDQAMQLRQLALGQSFVHASALQVGTGAVVLAGWGGVGKTSSVLNLVADGAAKYLSDDLAVIDEGGVVYRSPKHLQVYPYNLEGAPALADRLLGRRSPSDRLQWRLRHRLYGSKKVRRRIAAEQFLGVDGVGTSAAVAKVVNLERGAFSAFRLREERAATIAARAAAVLVEELRPLPTVSNACVATDSDLVPPTGAWEGASREVLTRAFGSARCYTMEIPRSATPGEMGEFLRRSVL